MKDRVADYKIPSCKCPNCGVENDGALATSINIPKPKAGDIVICIDCQAISIYTTNFSLREPTEAEILKLPLLKISRAQRALRAAKEEIKLEQEDITEEEAQAISDEWDREMLGDDADILRDHDIGNK